MCVETLHRGGDTEAHVHVLATDRHGRCHEHVHRPRLLAREFCCVIAHALELGEEDALASFISIVTEGAGDERVAGSGDGDAIAYLPTQPARGGPVCLLLLLLSLSCVLSWLVLRARCTAERAEPLRAHCLSSCRARRSSPCFTATCIGILCTVCTCALSVDYSKLLYLSRTAEPASTSDTPGTPAFARAVFDLQS